MENVLDINSREELNEIAREENLTINWKKWNKIVRETKKDIKKALKGFKETKRYKNGRLFRKVYVLSNKGKLIETFNTPRECGERYNISLQQVNYYMRNGKPYKKLIYFKTTRR